MKFRLIESKADQDNFRNWLLQEYSNSGLPEVIYTSKVDSIVQEFDKYKNMNKFSDPAMKDYYYWINKHTTSELNNELNRIHDELEQKHHDKQVKRELLAKGAKEIFNKDGYKGYKVTTYDAMKYIGAGTEWCVAGSRRWVNSDPTEDPEKQGRQHFESEMIGDAYYVLVTPNKISWSVEDNGIINEYSGVDKYCVQYDIDSVIVWNVSDYQIWCDDLDYTILSKFEFIRALKEDQEIPIKTAKMLYQFIDNIVTTSVPLPKLAKLIRDDVLVIDDDSYEELDKIEIQNWNRAFVQISEFQKLNVLIDSKKFEFIKGIFKDTQFNKITITDRSYNVDYISEDAFHNSTITEFECYAPVGKIAEDAFSDCPELTKVLIDSGSEGEEEIIVSGSFSNCPKLESIVMMNTVYVKDDFIYNCPNLKYFHCNSLTSILDMEDYLAPELNVIDKIEIDDKDNAEELREAGLTNII